MRLFTNPASLASQNTTKHNNYSFVRKIEHQKKEGNLVREIYHPENERSDRLKHEHSRYIVSRKAMPVGIDTREVNSHLVWGCFKGALGSSEEDSDIFVLGYEPTAMRFARMSRKARKTKNKLNSPKLSPMGTARKLLMSPAKFAPSLTNVANSASEKYVDGEKKTGEGETERKNVTEHTTSEAIFYCSSRSDKYVHSSERTTEEKCDE